MSHIKDDLILGQMKHSVYSKRQFNPNVSYTDLGDDVDNCPKGSKELKRFDTCDPVLSGTGITAPSAVGKRFMAAARLDPGSAEIGVNNERLVPLQTIDPTTDFDDLWFVCPYGADVTVNGRHVNKGIAIHLKNAFNTTGYQLTTTDRAKGTFSFEFHGHPSIATPDDIPYEVYYIGTYNSGNAVMNPGEE